MIEKCQNQQKLHLRGLVTIIQRRVVKLNLGFQGVKIDPIILDYRAGAALFHEGDQNDRRNLVINSVVYEVVGILCTYGSRTARFIVANASASASAAISTDSCRPAAPCTTLHT